MTGEKHLEIEPFLMVVLSRRFEIITRQMTNTLLRSARSVVINTARDFSCGIADNEARVICLGEGLPIHIASSGLIARTMTDLFPDLASGDCFLNNSPYHGNTHHADHTISVPVFFEGGHLFTTIARAHQADCGNCQPTTYMPFAKDIYEEGALNFPCVRVQRNHRDVEDVLRMARMRIRVPDLWYGDFLAAVGACRIGEREIISLCRKYGPETIKAFVEQWHEYGRQRMMEAIRRLPEGIWTNETRLDPFIFVADRGLGIRVRMTVNPTEGRITLDFSESDDAVPGGLNMSRATVIAAGITGVLNVLDPTLPKNGGAFSRIEFIMREGSVVGPAQHPSCASMATTTVADRVVNVVQSCFAQIGEEIGMAEGALGMPASSSVISGTDRRRGGAPYINQLTIGGMGGPAVHGYDGYPAYGIPVAGGVLHSDSVEVDEQRFPILFERNELIPDSGGTGRWRGAPGVECRIRQRFDPGVWIYPIDGHHNPARGTSGGGPGRRQDVWKYSLTDGRRVELPKVSQEILNPGEVLVSESGGGGGFGNPLRRDPEKVSRDVREGYVSLEQARMTYGVVLDPESQTHEVQVEATRELRLRLQEK
ncbi:MAG: hydantoinase B/oxoprolinase family protein [Thermodesulfobacteriota bacterium]